MSEPTALDDGIQAHLFIEAKCLGHGTRLKPPRCSDADPYPMSSAGPKPCGHDRGKRGKTGYHTPSGVSFDENARYFGLRRDKAGAFQWIRTRLTYDGTLPGRTLENIAACSVHGLSFWAETPWVNKIWAVDEFQQHHTIEINRKEQTCYGPRGIKKSWAKAPTMRQLQLQLDPTMPETEEEPEVPTKTPPQDKVPYKRRGSLINGPGNPFNQPEMGSDAHKAQLAAGEASRGKNPFDARLDAREQAISEWEGQIEAMDGPAPAAEPENAESPSKPARKPAKAKTPPKGGKTDSGSYSRPKKVTMTVSAAIKLLKHDPDYLGDIPSERLVDLLDVTIDPVVKRTHPKIKAELRSRGLTQSKAEGITAWVEHYK